MCLKTSATTAASITILLWLCCRRCDALRNATYRKYGQPCFVFPLLHVLPQSMTYCDYIRYCKSINSVSSLPETFSLASVCPQLQPDAYAYSENDLPQTWEPKTINLGLGVATLLNERLNGSVFPLHPQSPSIDCTFQVTTGPESSGIFVVLSQLSALRRWANGSCQDYLKISYGNVYNAAICGPVGQSRESSVLSFDSSVGVVDVQLHLDNSGSERVRDLRLKLVLTSYFDCAKERNGFSCTSTNERCIPLEYVGDGLINCDVPSCRDEGSCVNRSDDGLEGLSDSLSITILIGLVSFVSTGLLFGLMLWFCLKRNFKQRLNASASTPNLEMELSNVFGTPQAGSAGGRRQRNLDEPGGSNMAAGGPSPSSDPPPSYDILFPDK